ncbi:MAG: leucine-rich repeat protein [Duncaniella sp.]|nr:leucine-rich repeat protein [Duncaniella sp.]
MNKSITQSLRLFIVLIVLLLPTVSFAYDFYVDGIYYNRKSSNEVEVTYSSSSSEYTGDIVIPEKVIYNGVEYSVTSIGHSTFDSCFKLLSVTIPNSVTSIGGYAFRSCHSLTSITIPNSVTSIGSNAFDGSGLTSVTIPNSVTEIGGWAFSDCSSLTSVTIRNSISNIPTYTFWHCRSLTSVSIPNSVTSIGSNAFSECSNLTSVTIPNSVTSIGGYAFYGSGLTSVTIPNSVTSIGGYAFSECSGLISVTLSNSLTSIENYSFYKCSGLTSVTIPNSVTTIGDRAFSYCSGLTSVAIPNSVTSIGGDAFTECSGLTSVTIPSSVTEIGNDAFYGCNALSTIFCMAQLPPSIGFFSFNYDIYDNASLTVPDDAVIAYKGHNVWGRFRRIWGAMQQLSWLTLNRTKWDGIEGEQFRLTATVEPANDTNKTTIEWSSSNESIATVDDNGLVKILNAGKCTITARTTDGSNLTAECSVTAAKQAEIVIDGIYYLISPTEVIIKDYGSECPTDIIIPKKIVYNDIEYVVTSIENGAFSGFSALSSITIPNTITSIGHSVFNYCKNLEELIIEDGETTLSLGFTSFSSSSMGEGLFFDCQLEKVYLGRNLEYETSMSTGYSPFYNQTGLVSVTIGSSVTSVENLAFTKCRAIKYLTCMAMLPPSLNNNSFDEAIYTNAVLMVPEDAVNAYKEHNVWGRFNRIRGISQSAINDTADDVEDADRPFDIYNIRGMLVKKGAVRDDLKYLIPDIYIIRQGHISSKFVVR